MSDFIYLASQSPRRSQLLDQLGIRHVLLLPDASEDAEALEVVRYGEAAKTYVQRVTGHKFDAALLRLGKRGLQQAPILCADTTVVLGREILGKPKDEKEAKRMLEKLAGRTHRILTAIVVGTSRRRIAACSESRVQFAPMTAREIAAYVATSEPMGKAGAYGIQGQASAFVQKISGSYSGIMGLPLYETALALKQFNIK